MDKDRNLVVAILGLQLALVQEGQLVEAMRAWIANKKIKFENLLLEKGFINLENKDFLADFADRYIAMNGNDPAKSLASLNSLGRVEKDIQDLGDEEIYQSLFGSSWLRKSLCQRLGIENPDLENQATATFQNYEEEFGGRFRVLRPHARGGLGQVSIAQDLEVHREVALKEIRPNYASDPRSRQRFMIEAEVTGRLEHPGIVPVYSLGTGENGNPYYVMRFIKGESLRDEIERLYSDKSFAASPGYKAALRRLVRRLIDVCNAIEYAHSRGVLHRDLKPGNIMLGKYGETLVVDWGLAKTGTKSTDSKSTDEQAFVPQSGDSSSVTEMGSVVGTLSYMSPEQAEGRLDALGPPSDVYSLGATLYTILTGESPIPKLPKEEMLELVRNGKIKPPEQVNPPAPLALAAICKKAMARKQSDRYPTSQQFAEDLELWLADEPIKAYPEPLLDRAGRLAKKHRTGLVSTFAILATALVGLGGANVVVQARNSELKTANNKIAENYKNVSVLSAKLIDIAEKILSKPFVDPLEVDWLRRTLTEEAYLSFEKMDLADFKDNGLAFTFAKIARISGNLKRSQRDFMVADQRTKKAITLLERIAEEDPSLDLRDFLAETYRDFGTLKKADGKLAEAKRALEKAKWITVGNLEIQPESKPYRRTFATIELEEASYFEEMLEFSQALEKAEKCCNFFKDLLDDLNTNENDGFLFLFSCAHRVKALSRLNKVNEASIIAKEAAEKGLKIVNDNPRDLNRALALARIFYSLGEGILNESGPTEQVEENLNEGYLLLEKLTVTAPRASFLYGFCEVCALRARLYRERGDYIEAEKELLVAIEKGRKLIEASKSPDFLDLTARMYLEASRLLEEVGDKDGAISFAKQASDFQSEACFANQSPQYEEGLNGINFHLSRISK